VGAAGIDGYTQGGRDHGRGPLLGASVCALFLLGLTLIVTPASAAPPALPLPGGKYIGETEKRQGKALSVKVRAAVNDSVLRGNVRYRCARIKARFRTEDGTFVARQRNRKGRVIFKASGTFKGMNRVVGTVERLKKSRRKKSCRPSGFKAKLANQGPIRTKTVSYGPFHTEPTGGHGEGGHGAGGNVGRANLEKPCAGCVIVGMLPELREADGARANFDTESMLHHIVFLNGGGKDATCNNWPERFFAAGNERAPFVLPRGYGYPVAAGDNWTLIADLMNMGEHPKQLFIEMTYFFVRVGDAAGMKGVKPAWWDIDNCSDSEYMTPAGLHVESRDFTVPPALAGELVAVGGHLHDHGDRIKLKNLSRDEMICNASAGYGNDRSYRGHIDRVGGCAGRPLARLGAGEKLRLKSRYDAPKAQHDVMGIMVGYVAPSR
jgi:hypothetical protein